MPPPSILNKKLDMYDHKHDVSMKGKIATTIKIFFFPFFLWRENTRIGFVASQIKYKDRLCHMKMQRVKN